jgi:hypothetical protein
LHPAVESGTDVPAAVESGPDLAAAWLPMASLFVEEVLLRAGHQHWSATDQLHLLNASVGVSKALWQSGAPDVC